MAVKLENEFLYVEIAEMGAEVTRIYDKTEDNEIFPINYLSLEEPSVELSVLAASTCTLLSNK